MQSVSAIERRTMAKADHQHIGHPIERFTLIAVARHLSGGGHTPATACSGSAVQAGSSKTLLGQGRP